MADLIEITSEDELDEVDRLSEKAESFFGRGSETFKSLVSSLIQTKSKNTELQDTQKQLDEIGSAFLTQSDDEKSVNSDVEIEENNNNHDKNYLSKEEEEEESQPSEHTDSDEENVMKTNDNSTSIRLDEKGTISKYDEQIDGTEEGYISSSSEEEEEKKNNSIEVIRDAQSESSDEEARNSTLPLSENSEEEEDTDHGEFPSKYVPQSEEDNEEIVSIEYADSSSSSSSFNDEERNSVDEEVDDDDDEIEKEDEQTEEEETSTHHVQSDLEHEEEKISNERSTRSISNQRRLTLDLSNAVENPMKDSLSAKRHEIDAYLRKHRITSDFFTRLDVEDSLSFYAAIGVAIDSDRARNSKTMRFWLCEKMCDHAFGLRVMDISRISTKESYDELPDIRDTTQTWLKRWKKSAYAKNTIPEKKKEILCKCIYGWYMDNDGNVDYILMCQMIADEYEVTFHIYRYNQLDGEISELDTIYPYATKQITKNVIYLLQHSLNRYDLLIPKYRADTMKALFQKHGYLPKNDRNDIVSISYSPSSRKTTTTTTAATANKKIKKSRSFITNSVLLAYDQSKNENIKIDDFKTIRGYKYILYALLSRKKDDGPDSKVYKIDNFLEAPMKQGLKAFIFGAYDRRSGNYGYDCGIVLKGQKTLESTDPHFTLSTSYHIVLCIYAENELQAKTFISKPMFKQLQSAILSV